MRNDRQCANRCAIGWMAGKKDESRAARKAKEGGRRRRSSRPVRRGPRPDGPHGHSRPVAARWARPLSPDEMFKKFDADNNDSLSREEFDKLTEFVHSHRPPGPRARRSRRSRFPWPWPGSPAADGPPRRAMVASPPRGEASRPRDGERRPRGDREGRPDGRRRSDEGDDRKGDADASS